MEFYLDKVFVSLSADDVKIGSRGYYADNLVNLKTCVEYEDKLAYGEVTRVHNKDCLYRFRIDNVIDKAFFYLVEECTEKVKEVTYEEWQKNPAPRMMWVWDYDEARKIKRKVVYIDTQNKNYPVITVHTGYTLNYKHCAEIKEPESEYEPEYEPEYEQEYEPEYEPED